MKTVKMMMSIVVFVLLISVVVIPITSSMINEAENKAENPGATASNRYSLADTLEATVVYDGAGAVTLNGEPAEDTYIAGDGIFIHLTPTRLGLIAGDEAGVYQSTNSVTITFSGSGWSYADTSSHSGEGTSDWYVYPDAAGNYFYTSTPKYVDPDDWIFIVDVNAARGNGVVAGPVDDLKVYATASNPILSATATYTEGTWTNSLESATLTLTDDTTAERTTGFIVPVIYSTGPETDSIVPTLVSIIPIVLIVGVVLYGVGSIIGNRRED